MSIEITGTQDTRAVGLPGHMPAGQPEAYVDSFVAVGAALPCGVGVMVSVSSPADGVQAVAMLAADTDALVTSTALGSTTNGTFSSFTGVLGGKVFNPPRAVSFTTAADADWDATTMTVFGTAPGGAYLRGTIAIANNGGTTAQTTELFETVTSFHIPPQSGSALGQLGLAAPTANTPMDIVGFVKRSEQQAMSISSGLSGDAANYAVGDDVAVCRRGRILVASENSGNRGDEVYVRAVATGNEKAGAVRTTPDSTDCLRARGWRLATATSGSDNLCLIERI